MGVPRPTDRPERLDEADASDVAPGPPSFESVYRAFFHEVSRWARAVGGPGVDHEDVTQEVFLVVRKKLARFDGRNLPGWLYRITTLKARAHRRRAWLRRAVRLGAEPPATLATHDSPAVLFERNEDRRLVERLLDRMSEAQRAAFVLFEIEGLSGEEIAELEGVPVNTVWTRLFHARRRFVALAAEEASKHDGRGG